MRSHRRQRGRGLTPPDPGGEWRFLGRSPDNSIGMPRPATARMTDAPVDRPQLGRTHESVASSAELNVRIHSAPAASLLRTRLEPRDHRGPLRSRFSMHQCGSVRRILKMPPFLFRPRAHKSHFGSTRSGLDARGGRCSWLTIRDRPGASASSVL
jgi:hypothetical protein